jgi:hypothetical protein
MLLVVLNHHVVAHSSVLAAQAQASDVSWAAIDFYLFRYGGRLKTQLQCVGHCVFKCIAASRKDVVRERDWFSWATSA